MTATDILRRMLDERGAEWEDMSAFGVLATLWHGEDAACTALEGADDIPHGKVSVQACLTPAQAIDATLGRGTCHRKWRKDGYAFCSECGYNITGPWAHWCPNCGKRVVE